MGELNKKIGPVVVPGVARVVVPELAPDHSANPGRSQGMDGIRELLEAARDRGLVSGHFRGLLHIAIGRRVTRVDGTTLSTGLTWRELAALLKALRFDRELVREYGADPEELAPRDRERFWYSAIAAARVDSAAAVAEAEQLVGLLKGLGFVVGPSPTAVVPGHPLTPIVKPTPQATLPESRSTKRKKKS